MLSIFLSLFLGSVLITAGDTPNQQNQTSKASETTTEQTEPSGVATVVEIKGEAKAVSKLTGDERVLKEGDALYLDEIISTSAGSSLQLEIADESLFTLSENTSIRMDLFDLDENKKDGHLTANVTKGVFRFVSGKVAKVKPENVNIEIPSGTIGIRGTVVLGEINGEKCLVSLEVEEGDKAQHRIVVSNKSGGQVQEVEITKPGFATVIENAQMAPKPIFELPQENKERFKQNLPTAKYLPRDAEGRPTMNPHVRDPQKYPGPMMKREDQKNTGGPNPPNGPGGSGPDKQNLNGQRPGNSVFSGRDKNFQEIQNPLQNPGSQNNFNQRSGEFGNFKPDFGRGESQQSSGFSQQGQFGGVPQGQGQKPFDQGNRPGGGAPAQGNGSRPGGGPKR